MCFEVTAFACRSAYEQLAGRIVMVKKKLSRDFSSEYN
jgi:hypothetical protein